MRFVFAFRLAESLPPGERRFVTCVCVALESFERRASLFV